MEEYAMDNELRSVMLFTHKDKFSYDFWDKNGFLH